ncbi:MAG TPA: hypothetical protein PLM80_03570 [Mesotoga sp.]|jgi:hypothetical protein|nr:hypothetical protein [Mesotoga sp.]MDI9375424.1 hypothetical protein [Thermotogota bacterium]MDD4477777.1 hypothetical protein [Mesotoga sp.]MDD5744487.1 hypothetical protein [Mesotoga sp.]HOI63838.1 hypothetical protein [Mesotoga sp.]
MLTTFLAIVGALFLLYLAIRYFPAFIKLVIGVGVVLVVVFAFAGLVVVFLPILIIIAIVLLVVKLVK